VYASEGETDEKGVFLIPGCMALYEQCTPTRATASAGTDAANGNANSVCAVYSS